MKSCLAGGYPFIFGIDVYSSFESDQANQTGVIPMPTPDDQLLGGHALVCVGYDDSKQYFIFRNSWSSAWGDMGYGYLPYEYMTDTNLCSDLWIIQKQQQVNYFLL